MISQHVALTWEPSRLQRGPYTGRGAKPAGLASDRTRSFSSLEFFHFPLEFLPIRILVKRHWSIVNRLRLTP
mgnify:CR=1 FL=1